MKIHLTKLALLATLIIVPGVDAQLLPRWFGPKATDKSVAAKPTQADPRRVTEVNVEVAWLADPVTFPYYLEAHAAGSQLEVRGYVPNKAVREHALRLAQVYSSLTVVDSMKEHPSLLVRPGQMSPQHLQSSVTSSLRVALPKQSQHLKAECGSDGKVYVVGVVNSYEEKMAVSHALRRLHGCTSVQNFTTLPTELVQSPPREKLPIIKTSNSMEPKSDKPVVALEKKSRSWWPFGRVQTTKNEPPLVEPRKPAIKDPVSPDAKNGPILISSEEPKKEAVKVDAPTPTKLTAADLQKRIQAAMPKVKSVEVQFTSAKALTITLELRSEDELKATAESVFALPELQNYLPELQFKISAP